MYEFRTDINGKYVELIRKFLLHSPDSYTIDAVHKVDDYVVLTFESKEDALLFVISGNYATIKEVSRPSIKEQLVTDFAQEITKAVDREILESILGCSNPGNKKDDRET